MKTSAESMSWYKKVNETWKSVGVNPDVWKSTPADYKIACKTIKALWKKEMGTKFPYELKQVTGNRDTWCRDRCTFTVNPEKGWAEIIHSLGHWMGYMKNLKRPHCAEHAAMEYRLAKYVAEKNLVELSNQELSKPKVKLRVNKVAQRYARMLKRKEKWANNLKRVANSLKKVEKSIVQYEKKYDEEKLTSKYQEPIVRKMPPKKDWQAMALDLAERYEGIKIECGYYYGNSKEIDLWYHGNRPAKWQYERSGQYPCMPRYSWRMIYNLAVETLQDDGVWND